MHTVSLLWGIAALAAIFECILRTGQPLAISIACASAALLASLGYGWQLWGTVGLFVAVACFAFLYLTAVGKRRLQGLDRTHNVVSDEGDRVHVEQWASDDETQVEYQGRIWAVRLAQGHQRRRGYYRVRNVEQSHLVLEPWGRDRPHRRRLFSLLR